MVTVPNPDHRNVITRSPFLDETLGELVAWHADEGPLIDVRIEPADTGDKVEFGLTPCEARQLADLLRQVADVAQRAGWTPAVLADVREHYLPGVSDEHIMDRLDQLTERLGDSVLGFRPGTLNRDAGRMLVAGIGAGVVEQASGALGDAIDRLSGLRNAVDQLSQIRDALADLQRFYRTEGEQKR